MFGILGSNSTQVRDSIMTPLNNSLYTVCLFLSLSCLLKWTELRRRRALRFRQSLAMVLMIDEPRA